MHRAVASLLALLLASGCSGLAPETADDADGAPDAEQEPPGSDAGREPARADGYGSCDRTPKETTWRDDALFGVLTADRGRWQFQVYPVGPGLPLSDEARRQWSGYNLTELEWRMEHPEPWAIHRALSLDGRGFLSAQMEQRFTDAEVRAGLDAFLDRILADPDAADRDDLWTTFNRSRAEGDAAVVHRDEHGPPYWGHFHTFGLWLPDALALNVTAVVDAHMLGRAPEPGTRGTTNGQRAGTGPWAFEWGMEVRSVGFSGTGDEGRATLRVDARGAVTFSGALWDEPDATEERWVSWMESILPEVGARVPDRGELRYPFLSC